MRKLIVGLIIALMLVFVSPTNTVGERGDMYDALSAPRSVVIANQTPLHLEIVRLTNSQYRLFGEITLCNQIFNIQGLGIGSESDSSMVMATPIIKDYTPADSCGVESFTLGIHGGALRKQIEKDGEAIIILYGAQYAVAVKLTPANETEILQIILRPKQNPI